MNQKIYSDPTLLIVSLIKHIREHGDFIETDKDPKMLRFYWKCSKTDKQWGVNLSAIQQITSPKTNPIRNILREVIQKDTSPEVWQKAIIQDKQAHDKIMQLWDLRVYW